MTTTHPFPEPRTCACGCGESFVPKRQTQIYATERCRKNAYWAKHEVVSGSEVAPSLSWALAKLDKHRADPRYKVLQTLLDRIDG